MAFRPQTVIFPGRKKHNWRPSVPKWRQTGSKRQYVFRMAFACQSCGALFNVAPCLCHNGKSVSAELSIQKFYGSESFARQWCQLSPVRFPDCYLFFHYFRGADVRFEILQVQSRLHLRCLSKP